MEEIELKNQIRELIGEGKLDAAIKMLSANTQDSEKIDELILQQARHNRVSKEIANGTVSIEDANKELNILIQNLLAFLRTEKLIVKSGVIKNENFKEIMVMSLTRIKVAEIFVESYDLNLPLTIAQIMTSSKLKSRKLVIDFLNELAHSNLLEKKRENRCTFWMINSKGRELLNFFVLKMD